MQAPSTNPFTFTANHDLGDAVAGLAVIGSVAEILPPLAALLAIVWTCIRMYEWFRYRILKQGDSERFK